MKVHVEFSKIQCLGLCRRRLWICTTSGIEGVACCGQSVALKDFARKPLNHIPQTCETNYVAERPI